MPFVTNRSQRIHYTVTGSGPTVVFQHGLFQCVDDWRDAGFVDGFADAYRVVCIDSLGHGQSDKPTDPKAYGRSARAADVIAVLDAIGASRAHLIGYSMGGWIASGVAVESPERLASIVIGGWDLLDGAAAIAAKTTGVPSEQLSFDQVLAVGRTLELRLNEWLTPDAEQGLQACWNAVAELEPGASAVALLDCPALIWLGEDDAPHGSMSAWAGGHGLPFLSVPGDHMGAFVTHNKESIEGLRQFVDQAEQRD